MAIVVISVYLGEDGVFNEIYLFCIQFYMHLDKTSGLIAEQISEGTRVNEN